MKIVYIEVPQENDVFLRIVILQTEYQIRFSYNDTEDNWTFGLYTPSLSPIVQGIKIVPNFPLNIFVDRTNMPNVVFGCETAEERVKRYDFRDKKAKFYYVCAD